jgi:rubrerythrin
MNTAGLTKDTILKLMDEDVKRTLKRQIEISKSESPSIHYQFAHYLLTKNSSVMDIFKAAESSSSEMEQIIQAHNLCLKSFKEDKNFVWICRDCKRVIGFFKKLSGMELALYIKYLVAMVDKCPVCNSNQAIIIQSDFLLSGLTMEQALSENKREVDKDAGAIEMFFVTKVMKLKGDNFIETLRKEIDLQKKVFGQTIKDIIKEGKIQYLSIKDDDGCWWNAFGKMSPEEGKKYGLTQK